MSSKLRSSTLTQAARGIKNGEFSSLELVSACWEKIKKTDQKIKSFLTLNKERAREAAKKVDSGKKNGLLAGVPVAIKDVLSTKDIRTTAGSQMLENYRPAFHSTVVKKLLGQGAIIIGKTNCHAFAFDASRENSGYFPTRNPHDLTRVPGGSSSGSASAVAANQVIFSLGTDTGGSIRQPASFCGVVGLKPTYGRCSRWGLIPMGSSFDCPGPITKTVKDAALTLQVIAGKDDKEATSADKPVPQYSKGLKENIKGTKIGIIKEFISSSNQKEVNLAVEKAAQALKRRGAQIKTISLPHAKQAIAVYYILVPAEISANMSRFDGVRFGHQSKKGQIAFEKSAFSRSEAFEDEVKRRIMIGSYTLSAGYFDAYYLKASQVRTLIINDFQVAFSEVDAILSPVAPTTAFKIGEKISDPVKMYLADIFTVPANVAGIPAISLPMGQDKNNLPIGIQIMGKYFEEKTILKIAYNLEQETA